MIQEVRHALRQLVRQWRLSLGAALSLALGIGGAAVVFSLVRLVLLDPIPVADTRDVYFVHRTFAQAGTTAGGLLGAGLLPCSYPDYEDFRDRSRSFASLVAETFGSFNLAGGGKPELVFGSLVSASYFETLRLRPHAGRFFLAEEDETRGSHPVVVLSHGLWARRFGSDLSLVGRDLALSGRRFTIVGVAPAGFRGVSPLAAPQLYVPAAMAAALANDPGIFGQLLAHRGVRAFSVFGRLREGVSPVAAGDELRTIAARLAEEHPQWNRNRSIHLENLAQAAINPALRGSTNAASLLLTGAVGLILLIACANVANLLLARGVARESEMATRLALGAPARRIVRQLLVETLVLWSLGGALGLLVGAWGLKVATRLLPPFLPPGAIEPTLDASVVAFAVGLTLVTGLGFGLAPALRAGRTDLMTVLRTRSDSATRSIGLRRVLVGAQVALAAVALVAAGAFVASLKNARGIELGFEPRGLSLVSLDLAARGWDVVRARVFHRALVERLSALAGVEDVALASNAPLSFAGSRRFFVPGAESLTGPDGIYITTNSVSPRYFTAMGLAPSEGRVFDEGDDENGRPVAVVNETMARRYWPGQPAVGRELRTPDRQEPIEVVGVVPDLKYATVGEAPAPYVYFPLAREYAPAVTVHVRGAQGPPSPAALVAAIGRLDPELAVINPRSMQQSLDEALWGARTAAQLTSGFGLLALLLASTGVYAVLSQLVAERRHEIGLRVALGATPGQIVGFALRHGGRLVAAGLGLGLLLAILTTRLFTGLLYGVVTANPAIYLAGPALLTLVALLACLLPARAAAHVDPLATLRE